MKKIMIFQKGYRIFLYFQGPSLQHKTAVRFQKLPGSFLVDFEKFGKLVFFNHFCVMEKLSRERDFFKTYRQIQPMHPWISLDLV